MRKSAKKRDKVEGCYYKFRTYQKKKIPKIQNARATEKICCHTRRILSQNIMMSVLSIQKKIFKNLNIEFIELEKEEEELQ